MAPEGTPDRVVDIDQTGTPDRVVDVDDPTSYVSSFNGRSGGVSPQQADYDSFFLTQTEGDGRYGQLGAANTFSQPVGFGRTPTIAPVEFQSDAQADAFVVYGRDNGGIDEAFHYFKNFAGNVTFMTLVTSSAGAEITTLAGTGMTIEGVLLKDGTIGVGNSAAATTPGTVTDKMEVFDASGASLGFVAIYDAIT